MSALLTLTTRPESITEEVATRILRFQNRCVACGSTYALHIHHRVFRSEGEHELRDFLEKAQTTYERTYGRPLKLWTMHSIQNLVVLCNSCHEGQGTGVHGGNEKLRLFLRLSFTCPLTGFNVPFRKQPAPVLIPDMSFSL